MRCTPHLGARLVGHVVGSCIMVAPAYASDTSGLDFQQFVDDVGRNRDFFISVATAAKSTFTFGQLVDAVKSADEAKRSADEAKRSADEAFKASPEGKIQEALARAMEPFEPSRPQDEVTQRPVMETLRQRIASWQQHATIIGGRCQSGKSVATEEALRGARGVARFTIKSADWETTIYEELKVENSGLFKEMMRRVREKLKDFPDNLTKFPILLLEVPRTTTEGLAGQNMSFQLSRAVQLLERTAAKSRQEVCQVAGWHLVSHSFHGSACAGMSWHQARHATRRFDFQPDYVLSCSGALGSFERRWVLHKLAFAP